MLSLPNINVSLTSNRSVLQILCLAHILNEDYDDNFIILFCYACFAYDYSCLRFHCDVALEPMKPMTKLYTTMAAATAIGDVKL